MPEPVHNPFQTPVLPTGGETSNGKSNAKSKAFSRYDRAARQKLGYARIALFVVGFLSALVATASLLNAPNEVQQATQDLEAQGLWVDSHAMLVFAYTIYGATLAASILFLLLGGVMPRWPRVTMLLGLTIYLSVQVMKVCIEPASIVRGLFFNVIIIYVLIQGAWTAFTKKTNETNAQPSNSVSQQ